MGRKHNVRERLGPRRTLIKADNPPPGNRNPSADSGSIRASSTNREDHLARLPRCRSLGDEILEKIAPRISVARYRDVIARLRYDKEFYFTGKIVPPRAKKVRVPLKSYPCRSKSQERVALGLHGIIRPVRIDSFGGFFFPRKP